ncbi:hypothetical protein CEXT_362421, partial [Caerostris extrusa]
YYLWQGYESYTKRCVSRVEVTCDDDVRLYVNKPFEFHEPNRREYRLITRGEKSLKPVSPGIFLEDLGSFEMRGLVKASSSGIRSMTTVKIPSAFSYCLWRVLAG